MVLEINNLPFNAGDVIDMGLIPGSGWSPGGGSGNPLQRSCLENPMDREACPVATVHRATKNWTRLKRLSTCAHMSTYTSCLDTRLSQYP